VNNNNKIPILGLLPHELKTMLSPLPSFRVDQIYHWIRRGISSFNAMNNLPENLRDDLEKRFTLRSSEITRCFESKDASLKLQIKLSDGLFIESLVLQDQFERKTACLSTQLGCPMACVFCKTGSMGFFRNLSAAEIVEQFFHLKENRAEISNIVFMGMGEPLLNLGELRQAIAVLTADDGKESFSKRRITISTCGIIKGIYDLAENGPAVRLAISITTADEALRQKLMPAAAENPLAELKKALHYYQGKQGKRITLEAVLLGGLNTRPEDIRSLIDFSKGLDVLINLIPWNAVEGLQFQGHTLYEPKSLEIRDFAAGLENAGLKTVRRSSRGRAVGGACGQLGGESSLP
jgi:23S rRNA (adenine2503-C2)-methyltransferase